MNIKFLVWPFLILVYFFILSINLTSLPLYLDEGIYIFWAYLFSLDPSYAYVSMQDGKTPLFIWATTSINFIFNNYIYSARIISVISSTFCLICALVISLKMFGKNNAISVYILFMVTPFNVLISRLGFADSLLTALFSLSLLGLFLTNEYAGKNQLYKVLISSFISGLFLGFAFLTKTTAKIFLATELIILMTWGFGTLYKKQFKPAILIGFSALIISAVYFEIMGYLRFGALRHWGMISEKESVLVFTIPEIFRKFFIEQDFSIHLKNLPVSIEYFGLYFGPILIFFVLGVYRIIKSKKNLWILLITLILTLGIFLSAKIPASRYYAIIIPEILIISGAGLFWVWDKKSLNLKITSIILLLISGFLSFKMISAPLEAYYASDDQANFVDYNLNSLGLKESVDYLEFRKETAAVAVTGIWGVAEGSLVSFKEKGIEAYPAPRVVNGLKKDDKPCPNDYQELEDKCWKLDFGELSNSTKEKYVYFISEHIEIDDLKKLIDLEIVKEFKRPRTNLSVYLLKLN